MVLDLELINGPRFRPAEPSQRELEAIAKIGPVDYSIYTRKLQLACRESKEVLKRLGISSFITAGDVAHGIYTANGDLAIAEVGTYMHVVTGILPIKFVLKHYMSDPEVAPHDGDIFFCNEAIYGGIHNPDMINFIPIFAQDELIAWVSSAAHEPETGATEVGGMPGSAKSRYDEGLKVPPIKIGQDFTLRRDLVELFENNVRYPLMITNDLAARTAACLRLRKRILEVTSERDKEFFVGLLRKIILATADVVTKRIAKVPDGVFRHVTFLDAIGHQKGLIRLPVTLVKEGGRMRFDFTRSSPQVPGPFNTFEHAVEAHITCNVFQYLLNDVPASAGCLVPFEIKTTKGSCLNAATDAAVSNVSFILPALINAVQILFIKALYSVPEFRKDEYVALPMSSAIGGFVVSGLNQWKRHVTTVLMALANSLGGGARPDKDGVDCAGFWFSGYAEAVDCEEEEATYPITLLLRNFVPDGGGPGKFRGGTGVSFGYMVKNTDQLVLLSVGGGDRFPSSQGVFGGYPATTNYTIIMKEALASFAKEENMPHSGMELVQRYLDKSNLRILSVSYPEIMLNNGDIFLKPTGGGGGYGDVLDRDPEMVMKDVALGRISHWAAKNIYHVSYDNQTLASDHEAVKKQRMIERNARIARGKPYLQFVQQWTKKKPRKEILQFYGDWPIPFNY